MSGKLLCLMTTASLLCSVGATNAREALRLTDEQLDRVSWRRAHPDAARDIISCQRK
jgi:hypothetical protein